MTGGAKQRLSVFEVARILYQTGEPTEAQLARVRHKLARGVLQGDLRGDWVAGDSVAAYLAARTLKAQRAAGNTSAGLPDSTSRRDAVRQSASLYHPEERELPRLYRQILRDYFSAVLRRRRPPSTSVAFDRAVLAGQIVLVLFPVVVIISAWWRITAPPPERVAVERWIDEQADKYHIVEWFPSQPRPDGTTVIRVRYRYSVDSPKPILTDRTFLVRGDDVHWLTEPD